MIAEIEEKYSIAEKNKAEARKIDAESKRIEFENAVQKLTISLKLTMAIILGSEGKESIILTKQIEMFLETLTDIKESNLLLE